jgi:hypothetical protein
VHKKNVCRKNALSAIRVRNEFVCHTRTQTEPTAKYARGCCTNCSNHGSLLSVFSLAVQQHALKLGDDVPNGWPVLGLLIHAGAHELPQGQRAHVVVGRDGQARSTHYDLEEG